MSGMTTSMPSICSSGNMSPASTRTMSLSCSMTIMFLPISPTPPSGMTRTVPLEPDVARGHLVGQRITVLGRAVTHDVRDEDLAAVEADAREQLIEHLARGADERPALNVLVVAGRLAEEEDPGFGAALAG